MSKEGQSRSFRSTGLEHAQLSIKNDDILCCFYYVVYHFCYYESHSYIDMIVDALAWHSNRISTNTEEKKYLYIGAQKNFIVL